MLMHEQELRERMLALAQAGMVKDTDPRRVMERAHAFLEFFDPPEPQPPTVQELLAPAPQQMTLGQFAEALKGINPFAYLSFDFCFFRPTMFGIFRRDHLAIGFSEAGEVAAGVLLRKCQEAATTAFLDAKGESQTFGESTPLWAAHLGTALGSMIVGVKTVGTRAVIMTAPDLTS